MNVKRLNIWTCTVLLGLSIAVSAYSQDVKPEILDALNTGDTALAVNLLNKEIELDKAYHLNYYMLGLIQFNRDNYANALKQFDIALDKKSKHYFSSILIFIYAPFVYSN